MRETSQQTFRKYGFWENIGICSNGLTWCGWYAIIPAYLIPSSSANQKRNSPACCRSNIWQCPTGIAVGHIFSTFHCRKWPVSHVPSLVYAFRLFLLQWLITSSDEMETFENLLRCKIDLLLARLSFTTVWRNYSPVVFLAWTGVEARCLLVAGKTFLTRHVKTLFRSRTGPRPSHKPRHFTGKMSTE